MNLQTNHSLSVDCVVFGFDGTSLKVLLVERDIAEAEKEGVPAKDYKLPGSMIFENEDLSTSAYRILKEMTGLSDLYLKQFHVFSAPDRVDDKELAWINRFYGISAKRVVTVAYYSLVKLTPFIISHTGRKNALWVKVDKVKRLAMDHKKILCEALSALTREVTQSPVAFELLPRKFTIRQLQRLYEAVFGVEIDNRNFRKKVLGAGFVVPTQERETGVAHKPAQYYVFNKGIYNRRVRERQRLCFINW